MSESSNPTISHAPRIETSAKSIKYEFRSIKSLLECLRDSTFKLVIEVYDKDFDATGRFHVNLKGRYSDRGVGSIHIGLMRNCIDVHEQDGKKRLVYDFLQEDEVDYDSRCLTEDTQEDWSAVRTYYNPILKEKLKKYYPDEDQVTVFEPKRLKMELPSENSSVTKMDGAGEADIVVPRFVLADHLRAPGRLMIRFGSMWSMHQKKFDNQMVGFLIAMDKSKQLSDSQKRDVVVKKLSDKRKRDTEKAAEAKKQKK